MLSPFFVVGVGGSGGKTVRGIRKALLSQLEQAGWTEGIPEAWQFLHIDTPVSQDGLDFPAPLLPLVDYLSLVPAGVSYSVVHGSLTSKMDGGSVVDLEKVLPSPAEVAVPIYLGAGAFRAIGRTISAASMGKIQNKVSAVLTRMKTAEAVAQLAQLGELLGGEVSGDRPTTGLIISSVAGGSGAGQFMDVAEAIKSASSHALWSEDMFALLYAPDVFAKLGQAGIPPNALGALVETMSGFWNSELSESTTALYHGQGLISSAADRYRVGPAYPYIIGSKNGQVSFGSQNNVYAAVSTSVAMWMLSSRVQDNLMGYTIANYSDRATKLEDHSGLRKTGGLHEKAEASPFSSMGFGRVALGLDRFFEYSAQRLAKAALRNLLERHLAADGQPDSKTEPQWVQHHADLAFGAFFQGAQLGHAAMTARVRPDISGPRKQLKSAIEQSARGGMPQGGHSYSGWVERILNGYRVNLPSILGEVRSDLLGAVRGWVETIEGELLSLVTLTASRQGLPVTVELLQRTIRKTKESLFELEHAQREYLAKSEDLQADVTQAMQPASSMAKIPANNAALAKGIVATTDALWNRAESEVARVVHEILADFIDNFLEPLRNSISSSTSLLKSNVDGQRLPDGRSNPFGSWPEAPPKAVPQEFAPAPNERLLIDYKFYGSEYDRLVGETMAGAPRNAMQGVLDEFTMGEYGSDEIRNLSESLRWNLLEMVGSWVPRQRDYQPREGADQSAAFILLADHIDYVDRAKRWLKVPGRQFANFLDQKLATWLDHKDPSVQSQRRTKFVKEFTGAVSSAAPLVERDPSLLLKIHPPKNDSDASKNSLVFSPMPVEPDSPLYKALENVWISAFSGDDDELAQFRNSCVGESGAPNVRQIDIFSVTRVPMQPMVLASVMEPIAQAWLANSAKQNLRANFMQWRRGRTLPESIPASPTIWRQMLIGWYVAKFLNQIRDENKTNEAVGNKFPEKGPKISIWVNGRQGYVTFPYPLYFAGIAARPDMPGVLMESMTIALVNVYSEKSLAPLAPYKRLTQLGDLTTIGPLSSWIREGEALEHDEPKPDESIAGAPSGIVAERKEKASSYFSTQLEDFEKYLDRQPKYGNLQAYPVSWEIRTQIREALSRIMQAIPPIEEDDDVL
jgi:hypothetical protein